MGPIVPPDLDALARGMLAEARKVAGAGPEAEAIARRHLERMLQAARSAGLGGELSAAELAALRRTLRAAAADCAWDLGGLGNRGSWAFGRVVEAVRSAGRAADPLLALAGIAAPRPDPAALAHAFQRLDAAFKGASADMARAVERQLVGAVTAGATPRDISRALLAENVVDPVAGMTPPARAEAIARTETMRVYRQTVREKAAVAGLTDYRMVGPVDQKTAPACRALVGRTLSAAEWQAIMGERWEGRHAGRGLHPNCRHSWQPVKREWVGAEGAERTGPWQSEVTREHDRDESLPAYTLNELVSLPAAERAELIGGGRGFRLRGAA